MIVVCIVVGMAILTKTTSATHGGVEHPDDDKRRGNPPFESIERHSQ